MPTAADFLLIFPSFMIGTGLGSLVTLGILGKGGTIRLNIRAIVLCAAGAAMGCGLAMLTENWWPPLAGPFVLSIGVAIAAGLLLPKPPRDEEGSAD